MVEVSGTFFNVHEFLGGLTAYFLAPLPPYPIDYRDCLSDRLPVCKLLFCKAVDSVLDWLLLNALQQESLRQSMDGRKARVERLGQFSTEGRSQPTPGGGLC